MSKKIFEWLNSLNKPGVFTLSKDNCTVDLMTDEFLEGDPTTDELIGSALRALEDTRPAMIIASKLVLVALYRVLENRLSTAEFRHFNVLLDLAAAKVVQDKASIEEGP